MECREIQTRLADYSVGLLNPRQRERVGAHLAGCTACTREWQALQGVMGLVEQFGALEPPPGLWNGVYNRVIVDEPAPAPVSIWQRLRAHPARAIGSTLAAAALAAAAWFYAVPPAVPPGAAEQPMVIAVREHALASSEALFADRTGLESLALLARYETRANGRPQSP